MPEREDRWNRISELQQQYPEMFTKGSAKRFFNNTTGPAIGLGLAGSAMIHSSRNNNQPSNKKESGNMEGLAKIAATPEEKRDKKVGRLDRRIGRTDARYQEIDKDLNNHYDYMQQSNKNLREREQNSNKAYLKGGALGGVLGLGAAGAMNYKGGPSLSQGLRRLGVGTSVGGSIGSGVAKLHQEYKDEQKDGLTDHPGRWSQGMVEPADFEEAKKQLAGKRQKLEAKRQALLGE